MDTNFSRMPIHHSHQHAMGSGKNTTPGSSSSSQMEALNRTKEVLVETISTLSSWGYTAFGQCFSKIRRNSQFDEEHQRSLLLSCHSTEASEAFQVLPDEAMLELRRRVQLTERNSYRHAILSKELAQRKKECHSSNRTQEIFPPTTSTPQQIVQQQNTQKPLTNAQQTLQEMLTRTSSSSEEKNDQKMRRMSVDELLSFDVELSVLEEESSSSSSSSFDHQTKVKKIHKWLEEIDSTRAEEYIVYAKNFEAQGFVSMEDLAALDEEDVEQAMSEVGISKFAHRTRIRKAILRLHHATAMAA
jgi:hypothetical protein